MNNINDLIQKVVDTEMNGIVKKIDERIAECSISANSKLSNSATRDYNETIIEALEEVREIILAEQTKPLTKGDEIRQNNERLALELARYQLGKISGIQIEPCQRTIDDIWDYLDQPQEDTNE